eukprot:5413988-Heterocapsa_arctica.AAC.1
MGRGKAKVRAKGTTLPTPTGSLLGTWKDCSGPGAKMRGRDHLWRPGRNASRANATRLVIRLRRLVNWQM